MHRHQHVAEMVVHRQLEQRGEVEDHQRAGEDQPGHRRGGDQPRVARVQGGQHPLAHPAGPVGAGRGGAGQHRHRRAEHPQRGHDHHHRHVLDHVGVEAELPPGRRAAGDHPGEGEAAGEEGEGAMPWPVVPAPGQTHRPGEVEARHHHGEGDRDPVRLDDGEHRRGRELLLGREEARQREHLEIAAGGDRLRHGRSGAAQRDRRPDHGGHQHALGEGEVAEAEPLAEPCALEGAEHGEDDEAERLGEHDPAVAGREQVSPARQPDPGADQAAERQRDHRGQGPGRVAADHDAEHLVVHPPGEQRDGQQSARPDGHGDEVQRHGVDGVDVVQARPGMPHQPQRQRPEAGEGEAPAGQHRGAGEGVGEGRERGKHGDEHLQPAERPAHRDVPDVQRGAGTGRLEPAERDLGEGGEGPQQRSGGGEAHGAAAQRVQHRRLAARGAGQQEHGGRARADGEEEAEVVQRAHDGQPEGHQRRGGHEGRRGQRPGGEHAEPRGEQGQQDQEGDRGGAEGAAGAAAARGGGLRDGRAHAPARRRRRVSKRQTVAAVCTFSDSAWPASGIRTVSGAAARVASSSPCASLPRIHAIRSGRSTSNSSESA